MFNIFKLNLNSDDLKSSFDDELYQLKDLNKNRFRVWMLCLLLILVVLWMSFFKLDVASHSTGEVIPATQTKPIQHLEGGIIREIFVKEGERVNKGQKLVAIERVSSKSDLASIQEQIVNLKIRKSRLKAQIKNSKELVIAGDIKKNYNSKVCTAKEILVSYKKKIEALKKTQYLKVAQQKAQLVELRVRNKHLNKKLQIINKQIEINNKLMKNGLANEYERLNLLKEKGEIVGGISETKAIINKIQTILSQEISKLNTLLTTEEEKLEIELEETINKLSELQEQSLKYKDTDERLLVVSPLDGTVLSLNIFSKGAIVSPGGTILSLVPSDDPLVIETKLEVGDVGLIKIGQKARIQLVSSTARNFQSISGEVVYISADRVVDKENVPFYIVRIKPNELSFKRGDISFPLIPGVRVQASILIGERTILDYLLAPFRSASKNALTET